MSFKFITNSISTRTNNPTLSDIVKAAQTKAAMEKAAQQSSGVVKTASAATATVKEAGEKGKGNIANLTAPKFGPGGKAVKEKAKDEKGEKDEKDPKAEASTKATVKVAEEKDEAETSGQPQAEAKLVNDPHKDPKLKDGGKGSDGGKASEKDEAESSGQPEAEAKLVNVPKVEGEGKKEAKSEKPVKKAHFEKIAELTPKQKEFVRKVWSLYWPKNFIDALLAD